ncbi:MAG: 4,5-DOPA dioxygenase extradiol [Reichenbachiella sp.]
MTSLSPMSLSALAKMTDDWPTQEKMPAFFVGHGNPMNALLENDITAGWRKMARDIKPRAILCVSAHWETSGTYVTMSEQPKTIHDFGGFPQALFDMQYPAPGAPHVGMELIELVDSRAVIEDHDMGLDHGTWTVLLKMFPEANVPVFQMSLDYKMTPMQHYQLGEELRALRKKGVLIVGSGNIIHNLGMAKWNSNQPYDWAVHFDDQIKEAVLRQDHKQLINFQSFGREADLSIPTSEHYLPLLYVLALREKGDEVQFFNETIHMGSMAMRSFVLSTK